MSEAGREGGGLTVGSLFSGVGGFDLGLERAGHRVLWQVEYDPQARSVLREHWPDVTIHEDVRNVGRANLAPVDVICGGFPCQDVSVAGRRAGLDGERSGLWFEFRRIVAELAPRWVLVENVPGLRSSQGGRDLAVVIRGLAELGYVGAWRSLDSQHFGVAQRRERVFLLACRYPGDGCPAEVLAIPEGLSGHPAPSREAREGSAGGATCGTLDSGNCRRPSGLMNESDVLVANALPIKYRGDPHEGTDTIVAFRKAQKAHDPDDGERWEEADAAGTPSSHSPTTGHVIAHTLRAEGHDASEDGTGRGVPLVVGFAPLQGGRSMPVTPESPTLEGGTGNKAPRASTPAATRARLSKAVSGGGNNMPHVMAYAIPRRLTPRECERLQGFPDDWTLHGVTDGKRVRLADSPRYRMMGNAVTVSVAEWIGRRLLEAITSEADRG